MVIDPKSWNNGSILDAAPLSYEMQGSSGTVRSMGDPGLNWNGRYKGQSVIGFQSRGKFATYDGAFGEHQILGVWLIGADIKVRDYMGFVLIIKSQFNYKSSN